MYVYINFKIIYSRMPLLNHTSGRSVTDLLLHWKNSSPRCSGDGISM